MRKHSELDPLTPGQVNICTYCGAFGVLLSLTCFIQMLIVGLNNWRVPLLLLFYFITAGSFFLLALQKHLAPPLLILSTVLMLMAQVIWMLGSAFSLVVLLLLLYCIAIVIIVYADQIPAQLKRKWQLLKEEEKEWQGKI